MLLYDAGPIIPILQMKKLRLTSFDLLIIGVSSEDMKITWIHLFNAPELPRSPLLFLYSAQLLFFLKSLETWSSITPHPHP